MLRAGFSACLAVLVAATTANAAAPRHGGHYEVRTSQGFLFGAADPEGVLHVAGDGRSLIFESAIWVHSRVCRVVYPEHVELDEKSRPAPRISTRGEIHYHVTRHFRAPYHRAEVISLDGRFVSADVFRGVIVVRFLLRGGGSCSTPMIRVVARHKPYKRYLPRP